MYYILSQLGLDRLKTLTGVPGLNRNDAYRLSVPLPPLSEQGRIVEILDQADDLRQKRAEADAKATNILPVLFYKMFGDPVTNPMGWKIGQLHLLCEQIVDCPHSTPNYSDIQTPFPCLRSSDIQKGYLDWSTTKYVDSAGYIERVSRTIPMVGDVIYCREGARFGNAARILEDRNVCLGQRMMLLRADAGIATPDFLWAILNFEGIRRQAFGKVSGSASPHVNVQDIKCFSTIIPPLAIQERFSEVVRLLDLAKEQSSATAQILDTLFSSLLHRGFSGDLTARWREAHMEELLKEMEHQAQELEAGAVE